MKNKLLNIIICFVALLAFGSAFLPHNLCAEIYSYVDKDGVVYFSNVPTSAKYRYIGPEEPKYITISYSGGDIHRYDYIIREASRVYDIKFELLKAIIQVESNFDPYAVSSSGAKGLMQIMPDNFQHLNISNPFDPRDNVMGGAKYLNNLMKRFNRDLSLSLAAYNAGPGAVAKYKSIPPYPETENYVKKVMKYYTHFSNR